MNKVPLLLRLNIVLMVKNLHCVRDTSESLKNLVQDDGNGGPLQTFCGGGKSSNTNAAGGTVLEQDKDIVQLLEFRNSRIRSNFQ